MSYAINGVGQVSPGILPPPRRPINWVLALGWIAVTATALGIFWGAQAGWGMGPRPTRNRRRRTRRRRRMVANVSVDREIDQIERAIVRGRDFQRRGMSPKEDFAEAMAAIARMTGEPLSERQRTRLLNLSGLARNTHRRLPRRLLKGRSAGRAYLYLERYQTSDRPYGIHYRGPRAKRARTFDFQTRPAAERTYRRLSRSLPKGSKKRSVR